MKIIKITWSLFAVLFILIVFGISPTYASTESEDLIILDSDQGSISQAIDITEYDLYIYQNDKHILISRFIDFDFIESSDNLIISESTLQDTFSTHLMYDDTFEQDVFEVVSLETNFTFIFYIDLNAYQIPYGTMFYEEIQLVLIKKDYQFDEIENSQLIITDKSIELLDGDLEDGWYLLVLDYGINLTKATNTELIAYKTGNHKLMYFNDSDFIRNYVYDLNNHTMHFNLYVENGYFKIVTLPGTFTEDLTEINLEAFAMSDHEMVIPSSNNHIRTLVVLIVFAAMIISVDYYYKKKRKVIKK